MVARLINGVPRNIPTKPNVPISSNYKYPGDLFAPVGDGTPNKFYTSIRMRTFSGLGLGSNPTGPSIFLPLPRKINDVQVLSWSQESFASIAAMLGVNLFNFLGGAAGAGVIVNPALFLQFKHPNFKSIEMSWTLVADNEAESQIIANIVEALKYHSSPTSQTLVMRYPDVFLVQLHPEPKFTFRIKPCIVEAVGVDYTGGEIPAFYKNGAPVAVNLSIRFREIEIWEKNSWQSSVTNPAGGAA